MSRWILLAVSVALLGGAFLLPPVPQDPSYHVFSDQAAWFSVPNFLNVASNLPFLLVGAWGLGTVAKLLASIPRPAYVLFCLAVMLVGIGSAYYHYSPGTDALVWDRLPMTMAFMALFSIVIGDRVSAPLGRWLLWPLVLAGVASVMYWDWTELQGRGDLRPYGLVQFLPMLLMPLLLVMEKGKGLRAPWLLATLGTYALAKLAEHFDAAIHAATGIVSGHSLKHLLGSLAVLWALRAMRDPVYD